MVQLTDAQMETAEARGRAELDAEPRAISARYDRDTQRIVVELINGCAYAVPSRLIQDLQGASDDALADVTVDGMGFNLHWPALDADLYVPALVAGIFGTRAWMTRELPKPGGSPVPRVRPARSRGTARG
jgi:hypothetical protein